MKTHIPQKSTISLSLEKCLVINVSHSVSAWPPKVSRVIRKRMFMLSFPDSNPVCWEEHFTSHGSQKVIKTLKDESSTTLDSQLAQYFSCLSVHSAFWSSTTGQNKVHLQSHLYHMMVLYYLVEDPEHRVVVGKYKEI